MPIVVFRQLIDAAIGSPDPGHVDFFALHCLLCHIADKLQILDTTVDTSKFGSPYAKKRKSQGSYFVTSPKRILGGADDANATVEAEETAPEATEAEPAAVEQADVPAESAAEPPAVVEEPAAAEDIPAETAQPPDGIPEPSVQPTLETTAAPVSEERTSANASQMPVESAVTDAEVAPILSARKTTSITERASEVKVQYIYEPISEDLMNGVSIMKEQIELAMEQINIMANMHMRGKRASLMKTLRDFNRKMRVIQRANMYIESKLKMDDIRESMSELISEEGLEEYEEEAVIELEEKKESSKSEIEVVPEPEPEPYIEPTLDYHLCYSPDKMMDQLLDLKSEFCTLTNKVNDIMVSLEEMDSQRTKVILAELQEQMRDARYLLTILKDGQEFMEQKQRAAMESILELERNIDHLHKTKPDRTEMELLLAEKVDFEQLERKVSHDQMREMLCRIEKQFCEMQRLINFNEKHALQVIENMRKNLGLDNIDQMLKNFRDKVDDDIQKLQTILQNYLDATNDDCAAAGARIKVMKDLACISCDTDCVMRTMEKSKVGKLPNAHTTPGLGPLITYEMGSIRKSGIMGYYRKDEFPNSPNAWLNRQNVSLKMCVPRHAGGLHTTHTAKEHVDKVVLSSKRAK